MPSIVRIFSLGTLPILFLSLTASVRSQDDEILGKKKSEWLTILENDENPRLRKAAVIALGIAGPGRKDILPALTKSLDKDKAEPVRLQIVTILANVHPNDLRDSLETLTEVLKKKDETASIRAGAATAIGKLGPNAKPALTALLAALKEHDLIKAAAVEAIGRIGPDAAKSAIVEMLPLLKSPDASVRFATVYAYSRLGPESAFVVPDLNLLLNSDPSAVVRHEVAKTFALFGVDAKLAIPALIKALREDKSEEVRRQVAQALGKMGMEIKPAVVSMIEVLQKDQDRLVRSHVVRSLSIALGADLKEHVKDLAEVLNKDPDGDVRLTIVQELGALGPNAIDALKALRDAENDVVLQVREAARAAQKLIMPPKKK